MENMCEDLKFVESMKQVIRGPFSTTENIHSEILSDLSEVRIRSREKMWNLGPNALSIILSSEQVTIMSNPKTIIMRPKRQTGIHNGNV